MLGKIVENVLRRRVLEEARIEHVGAARDRDVHVIDGIARPTIFPLRFFLWRSTIKSSLSAIAFAFARAKVLQLMTSFCVPVLRMVSVAFFTPFNAAVMTGSVSVHPHTLSTAKTDTLPRPPDTSTAMPWLGAPFPWIRSTLTTARHR